MAAIIIVEDGTNVTGSNSYISVADAEAYFANLVMNDSWIANTDADLKTRLLITASKILDSNVDFNGWQAHSNQSMQWPRILARNPDRFSGGYGYGATGGIWWRGFPAEFLSANWNACTIPVPLKEAVCEMARFLLDAKNGNDDRTSDPAGTGISSFEIYQGIKVAFDKADSRPIIPDSIMYMLQRFGQVKSESITNARVVRT